MIINKDDFQQKAHLDTKFYPDELLAATYESLRKTCNEIYINTKRHQKLHNFNRILDNVYSYCVQGGVIDKKRCLLCGITWLPGKNYAVNLNEFIKLFGRQKNDINKAFLQLNFKSKFKRADRYTPLHTFFPFLSIREFKYWSIRVCDNETTNIKYFSRIYPDEFPVVDI